jgi:hypothetical protein
MPGQEFYNEEEAEQILRLAASRSAPGGMSRERLLEVADELGITPEAVAEAERLHRGKATEEQEYRLFLKEQKSGFYGHLVSYLIVNAFLFAINVITSPGNLWFMYPMLGWGIGIAFHAAATFLRGNSIHSEAFRDWQRERGGRRPAGREAEL